MAAAVASSASPSSKFDWESLPPALKVVFDKQGHRQEVIDGATFWNFLTKCTVAPENTGASAPTLSGLDPGHQGDHGDNGSDIMQQLGVRSGGGMEPNEENLMSFLQLLLDKAQLQRRGEEGREQGDTENGGDWEDVSSEVAIPVEGEDSDEETNTKPDERHRLLARKSKEGKRGKRGQTEERPPAAHDALRAFMEEYVRSEAKRSGLMDAEDVTGADNDLTGGEGGGDAGDNSIIIAQLLNALGGPGGMMNMLMGGGGDAVPPSATANRMEKLKKLIKERRDDPERQFEADVWEQIMQASTVIETIDQQQRVKEPGLAASE